MSFLGCKMDEVVQLVRQQECCVFWDVAAGPYSRLHHLSTWITQADQKKKTSNRPEKSVAGELVSKQMCSLGQVPVNPRNWTRSCCLSEELLRVACWCCMWRHQRGCCQATNTTLQFSDAEILWKIQPSLSFCKTLYFLTVKESTEAFLYFFLV